MTHFADRSILKHDFIETISRLYLEKHKPEHYVKLLETEAQDPSSPISFARLALRKGRTFFDLLSKHEGFLALQSYFIKAALFVDRESLDLGMEGAYMTTGGHKTTASNLCIEVDEFKFFKIMTNVIAVPNHGIDD